jgi:hypothetical protein
MGQAKKAIFVQNKDRSMRSLIFISVLVLSLVLIEAPGVRAQCSICTRTAQQLGERPARALNNGIIYLAAAPFAIFGIIGYRWWKSNARQSDID